MLKEGFEQIFRRAMNLRNTQVIKHLLMVVELKGKIWEGSEKKEIVLIWTIEDTEIE